MADLRACDRRCPGHLATGPVHHAGGQHSDRLAHRIGNRGALCRLREVRKAGPGPASGRADPDAILDLLLDVVRTGGHQSEPVRGPQCRPGRPRDDGSRIDAAELQPALHLSVRAGLRLAVDGAVETLGKPDAGAEIRVRHHPGRAWLPRPRLRHLPRRPGRFGRAHLAGARLSSAYDRRALSLADRLVDGDEAYRAADRRLHDGRLVPVDGGGGIRGGALRQACERCRPKAGSSSTRSPRSPAIAISSCFSPKSRSWSGFSC